MSNPFISDLYNVRANVKKQVVNRSKTPLISKDGEILDDMYEAVIKEKRIDSSDFVKVYPFGMQKIGDLSLKAIKVLMYVMSEVGYKDTIDFDLRTAKEHTGYKSGTSVYNGLVELKKTGFISDHKRKGRYYINPLCFYRGNRLSLFRNYGSMKVKKENVE